MGRHREAMAAQRQIDGTLKDPVEWDDDMAAAVAQVEVDELPDHVRTDGKASTVHRTRPTRLKFWDKNAALEKAFRHLGLYNRDNTQRSENLSLQVVLVGKP